MAALGADYAGRARVFLGSRERHERFVERTWTDLLRRAPSDAERDREASALDAGARVEDLVARVAASDEYHDAARP
jgi:hypothetical protein